MNKKIYRYPYRKSDWDQSVHSRCFVHIANSLVRRSITGEESPTVTFAAAEYSSVGLPWFDYYDDNNVALSGSQVLGKMKSVQHFAKIKGDKPLPENEGVNTVNIIKLRK